MPTAASVPVRPREHLASLLERKRMIDGAWVVCLLVVLGAVALLWFIRVLEIDLSRVAAWVFVYTAAHLLVATLSERLTSTVAVGASLRAMTISSVIFLAFLWHEVGGLKHPMFLAVFTLPVIMGGILLVGRQAQITAAVSVVAVVLMALAESPDLRWYAARWHASWAANLGSALASMLPAVEAFPDMEPGPGYQFALLETFAAVQFTVAFLSRPLATLLVRVNSRLEVSGKLLTEVQGLFHAVLRAEPDPAVILYGDSYQVVQASDSFFKRMIVRPSEIMGKTVFEIVSFARAGAVREALAAPSGNLPFCVYRVHDETRIANVSFHRTEHQGLSYVYVGWQEVTELYYLQTAFDTLDDPLLVIGTDSRLQYANDHAHRMFGPLHFGMTTMAAPKLASLLDEIPADGSDGGRIAIDGQPYDVHRMAPRGVGEPGACVIVWLHCVAREEALFEQAVRDPLTGVYNRRYFNDALARHVVTSKAGRPLACAYFDLDEFKPINDLLGHAAGDAALLAFVEAIKSQLRAVDVLARLGGDEFAVLFVNCDTDVAASAIRRIRTNLDRHGWTYDGQVRPLSFSSGLAACHPDDDVESLLQRTDKAVYAAKTGGRGRTAFDA
jgi:diguanylate cyclase (GGDEF)-like protein